MQLLNNVFLTVDKESTENSGFSNTTSLNSALGLPGLFAVFSNYHLNNLHIVGISLSCVSLLAGIFGIFCLHNMDTRRRVFRHDLIMYLMICDFLKTLILMIYPIVLLIKPSKKGDPRFYNTLGFLTAYAIEGADFAIMVFAIHFAVLIFKPNWKWKNKQTNNTEGGLYRVRYLIWPTSFCIPILFASLAFIDFNEVFSKIALKYTNIIVDNNVYSFDSQGRKGGYKPLATLSYLPPVPYWYKLVLSWGPRYLLIVSICTIYISIYIYVSRETSLIGVKMNSIKAKKTIGLCQNGNCNHSSWLAKLKNRFSDAPNNEAVTENRVAMVTYTSDDSSKFDCTLKTDFNVLQFNDISQTLESSQESVKLFSSRSSSPSRKISINQEIQNNNKVKDTKIMLQLETLNEIEKRRAKILSNLKTIFIYPISYILLWVFPLVIDITQYRYEIRHGPIIWLAYIGAAVAPLSSLVDTLVLSYRETPWNHSWSAVQYEELKNEYQMAGRLHNRTIRNLCESELGKKGWYYYNTKFTPLKGVLHQNDSIHMELTDTNSDEKLNNELQEILQNISLFWKFVHKLPLLRGINLFELDQDIRQTYKRQAEALSKCPDNFNMLDATNSLRVLTNTDNRTIDMNDGSQNSSSTDLTTISYHDEIHQTTYDHLLVQNQTLSEIDFSDVVRDAQSSPPNYTRQNHSDDKMDLFEFLQTGNNDNQNNEQ